MAAAPKPTKPFVTVSSNGLANRTSAVPNDGADFGPDTPGTKTNGAQEAVDYLVGRYKGPKATAPVGGSIMFHPGFQLPSTLVIPVWLGLHLEASDINFTGSGNVDAIQIGFNYADIHGVLLGNSIIKIGTLRGPNRFGAITAPNPAGTTGIHVKQFAGGTLEIGSIMGFGNIGLWFDNNDPNSGFNACASTTVTVGVISNCGVGLQINSDSPDGSFFGSNFVRVGDLATNFYGGLLDAMTDAAGNLTYTKQKTVNNWFHLTAEDSSSVSVPKPPPEACDLYFNCSQNYIFSQAKHLRLRGANNWILSVFVFAFDDYNPGANRIVFAQARQGFGIATPAPPAGLGRPSAVANRLPFPVRVYQSVVGPNSNGTHIVDFFGHDVALPTDPVEFTLDPGASVYYTTSVPRFWRWYGT